MPRRKKPVPVIFSTHPLHPEAAARLKGHGELVVASAIDPVTLADEAREADIVIVRANLPPVLFERAAKLRAAIRHGAGLDMIPMEAAAKAGVLVANVPGANARTVAEHVLWTTMALLRKFRSVDRGLREAGWLAGREHANEGHDLSGRTMGIIGFGWLLVSGRRRVPSPPARITAFMSFSQVFRRATRPVRSARTARPPNS